MTLIEPYCADEELAVEIEASKPGTGLSLWWLGQSGFLLKSPSGRVLFDPYLSDSLTAKYAHTDKPHVRLTRQVIAPEKLVDLDLITSSHNHTDHLDRETLLPLFAANPQAKFAIPAANREFVAKRLDCDLSWPIGMNDGQSLHFDWGKLQAVPAAHNELDRDSAGRCLYLGYILEIDGMKVYHSGDTLWYDGIVEILKPWEIDLALLPINGNLPERRVAGNLWGDEAARLAKAIGARLVIPCHYDMFAFNTESPKLFVTTCEALGQPYRVLQCGELLRFSN